MRAVKAIAGFAVVLSALAVLPVPSAERVPLDAPLAADPALLDQAKTLLTELHYYLGPQPGEPDAHVLLRAVTNWLFHHDLAAATPITKDLLAMMQADLDKGDLFPLVNTPIDAHDVEELPRSPDEPATAPNPER
jgi:hypothetical protein